MEESDADLEQYLFGLEAAQFVWNMLWKRDQPAFTEMNTLDVVQLSSSGITGWIFTAADGAIRSKLQSRWNAASIVERASGDAKKEVLADFYEASSQKYIVLNNKLVLKELVEAPHTNPSALILYGHLSGSTISYMEVSYDFPITIVKSAPPKVTCYNLVDSKSRGRIVSETEAASSLVPTDKVQCLNKGINATIKTYVQSLVKKIEKKYKNHVSKLSMVIVLEAIPANEFAHLHPNQRDSVPDKRVWLHHCTELVTVKEKTKNSRRQSQFFGDGSGSEMGTVQSYGDYSAVSGTTLTSRTAKLGLSCIGDFCFYNSIESRKSGFDFLDDEEFNLKEETQKAISRHRKVDQEADPDSDPDEIDEFDKTFEEKPIASTNAAVNMNQNSLKASATSASVKSNTGAAVVPVKSMKVALKSIILARDEMAAIERLEQVMINQEMAKVARGGSHKNHIDSTALSTTEEELQNSSGSHWPKALQTWWLQVGRSLTKNKGGVVSIPLSSGHKIDQARLSSLASANENANTVKDLNDANMDQYMDAIAKSDSVGGDQAMAPNQKDHKNNLGHLSWYYSNVRVCEHCYLVYRELDRKRKLKYKKLLSSQRLEQEKRDENKGKEIERKIFEQRQFVSRLAKIDPKRLADEANLQNHSSVIGRSNSYGIAGGNSLAFDSVLTDSNSYFDQAAALHYERELQAKKASKQPLVGAPKGALPPLPWQLSNTSQRELYEKTGNTFAVRNILEMKLDRHASAMLHDPDDNIEDVWKEATGIAGGLEDGSRTSSLNASMRLMQEKRRSQKKGQLLGKIQSSKSGKHSSAAAGGGGGAGATYNADRLMHPWQRDLQKLRQLQAKNNAAIGGGADGGDGSVLDQLDRHDEDEEEVDEEEDEEDVPQFRSGVQRSHRMGGVGSHTMKVSRSHKAVIGKRSPTRRVNSLPSLHHNPRKAAAAVDDSHPLLPSEGSMVSQLTMGTALSRGSGGGVGLMQSSVDDDDFLSGKMYHSPKGGQGKKSGSAGGGGHSKPPLKPLIQLSSVTHNQQTHQQLVSPTHGAASAAGSNKHFNHLKSMINKEAASLSVTLNPVNPALITATIVNRHDAASAGGAGVESSDRATPDSLHSGGFLSPVRRGSGSASPLRSGLASGDGSRPTTSQQGSRGSANSSRGGLGLGGLGGASPGRPLHKAPLAPMDVPTATSSSSHGGSSPSASLLKKPGSAGLLQVAGGGAGSSPFSSSQLSRSSSSKMLKRSDSIAEMDFESDEDEDDDAASNRSDYHTMKVSPSKGSTNNSNTSPNKSLKTQVVNATVHRTPNPTTSTTASSAGADDSGGESDDDDDVGGPIGYSPFVISFKV